jgi:hypothetical protein
MPKQVNRKIGIVTMSAKMMIAFTARFRKLFCIFALEFQPHQRRLNKASHTKNIHQMPAAIIFIPFILCQTGRSPVNFYKTT